MDEGEELPPGTGIISSIRAERSPFHSFAGEVIDNSFDAGATRIDLIMSPDKLSVSDNGIGIRRDREQALVKLAQHEDLPNTRLGRYGIGLKNKAIAHGNILRIVSTSVDGRMMRLVDWEAIRESGRWFYPMAVHSPYSGPTGTTITIEQLTRAPTKADITRTSAEIQRRYYPALEKPNMVITLNGLDILPIAQPDLEFVVEDMRDFPGGRVAVVRGGILKNPSAAKLHQVDIVVDFRVIKPESMLGCNGYGGTRSMFARVELGGPWHLTKFKDDLADDPYEDDLEEWVAEVLEPILERCSSEAMYMRNKDLEQHINEMLPDSLRMVRPNKKRELGRVGKKLGRVGRLNGPVDEPGPARGMIRPRGIKIEFASDLNEQYGYGRSLVHKKASIIQLASDNPTVHELMEMRDKHSAAQALYAFASFIYEGELRAVDQNYRMLDENFGLSAWRMGRQNTDGEQQAA